MIFNLSGSSSKAESTAILRQNYDQNGAIEKNITTLGNVPLTIVDTLDEGGGTIKSITADHVLKLQAKTVDVIAETTNITASTGYDGLSEVIVHMSVEYIDGNNLAYGFTDNTSSRIGAGEIDYMEVE